MSARRGHPSVVFLNRYYWPDTAATAQMLADLAEDAAAAGWTVTVIASRRSYTGGGGLLPSEESYRGVRILRIGGPNFGRMGLLGRMADYLGYLIGATLRLWRLPRQDYLVAMSDPPLLIALPVLMSFLGRGRAVYWVQDLFPQLAARLGVLSERSVVYRLADRVARWLNDQCDQIIALGPRMAQEVVEAGGQASRTQFVHNWADADAVRPVPADKNPFIREHGLDGKFVVLYSGNAGRAHPFEGILDAARRLKDQEDIIFLIVGGGPRVPEIRAFAEQHRLRNLRILGYVPRAELTNSLSAASVSLVAEDPAVAGLLVPSKAYGILASGRPILFLGDRDSDLGRLVTSEGVGIVLPPEDGASLAQAIRQLREDPSARLAYGRRARESAEQRYGRSVATGRWMEVVAGPAKGLPAIH